MKSKSRITHVNAANRPTMVDVGGKPATLRQASAEAVVKLPPAVARELLKSGHRTKKGPVFDTAIIAGVMAAKKAHEIIPFCHPLALERCDVDIRDSVRGTIRVTCNVAVHHKTGVEMEALTGAMAAALTIYDMCKALSHDIEIGPVRLLHKTGGKRDFARAARASTGGDRGQKG